MKKIYSIPIYFSLAFLLSLPHLLSAQCGAFYDGFEAGTLGPQWQIGTGAYVRNVVTTTPAVGQYAFEHVSTTSNSFYQGTYAVFTPSQPSYMSFWVRTNTTTGANGYVVAGDGNIATDNGVLFFYFNGTSQLRFFNSAGQNYPIVANQWYHVEARDVDWVARNMDIWIDGVLFLSNWAFRSGTATSIDRVHLQSLVASTAMYDNIQIGVAGPSIDNIAISTPTCPGTSGGGIDLTTSSPNGNMSYQWSTGDTTQDISNLVAGTYAVSITDLLGCITTDSITVTDPADIAGTANILTTICPLDQTGSIDLTPQGGTPGYTFQWSNGATTEDLSGLMAGNYGLTITDANGCTGVDTLTVNGPSPFDPQAAISSPTCFNGNDGEILTNMTGGTAGYSFLWSTGDIAGTITGLASGPYFLTVTDALGCSYIDTFTVVNPAQVAGNGVIQPLSCNGDQTGAVNLTPSNGTPVYSFTWSTSSIQEDLVNVSAGSYTVTIVDANGCTTTETYVVTEPAAVSGSAVITNATTQPAPGAIDLTPAGGTPPYSYQWSNAATTQDLSNLPAGTYSVTITDANGCTTSQSFFVDLVLSNAHAIAAQVRAWPNPFSSALQLDVQGIGVAPVQARIQDLAGRVLWERTLTQDGQVEVAFDAAAGIYLLDLRQGDARSTIKLNKR
jgi:hypothetical protein